MERLSVPRIVISGVSPGVGKSVVVLGLAMELKQRGLSVSCCVVGPNFQQATLLKGITDRYVHVLDPNIQSEGQVIESVYMAGIGADIILIEGAGTLLEPIPGEGYAGGPDSFVAKAIYAPICPIFDVSHDETAAVENLLFNTNMLPSIDIGPAIANHLSPDQPELIKTLTRINQLLVEKSKPPLLGVVPRIEGPEKLPSHGIHQTRMSPPISRQYLMELSNIIARCVDVDELRRTAARAQTMIIEDYSYRPSARTCRIGVSFDNAFGLCFQDNLSFLKFYGADVVPFSILADTSLPKGVGGIYLTGGYLTEYGTDLMNNKGMIRAIQAFHDKGGAIYAEGAGAAYLCSNFTLTDHKTKLDGVDLVPGEAAPGDGQEWYFKGTLMEDSILGSVDTKVNGIVTGDWQIKHPERMLRCLRMIRGNEGSLLEGFSPTGQTFATFAFMQWGSNPIVAKSFVDSCTVFGGYSS